MNTNKQECTKPEISDLDLVDPLCLIYPTL